MRQSTDLYYLESFFVLIYPQALLEITPFKFPNKQAFTQQRNWGTTTIIPPNQLLPDVFSAELTKNTE